MDFDFSAAQLTVQAAARTFGWEQIAPVATANDRDEIFPRNILQKLAPPGLMTPTLPSELGGLGTDICEGSSQIQKLIIGRHLTGENTFV